MASTGVKLPIIAQFTSADEILQALTVRDSALLTAALLQVDKSCSALLSKPAPRSEKAPILDYLTKYPTTDAVFAAWDTAHKTNNSQLAAAVLTTLASLIRLISTDPFASEPEIIRRLLSQYGSHLDRALNPGRNDVTVAALKLCNVVVGFGSGRFARRLFGSMQWLPKIMTRLFRTRLRDSDRDPLTKPDIRTLLTMLVVTFLSTGDTKLKLQVLEMKSLTTGILKGLAEDPEVVVNHVLITLHRDVIEDRSIPLEARRGLFDESCIIELVKLYDAPASTDPIQSPSSSINRFLYSITDWLAIQIDASPARSFGPQKVLGTILRTLKTADDPLQRELGLYILDRAPISAGPFWAKFPSSLDPRLSSRWISTITFATQVVSLPLPLLPSSLPPPALSTILPTILPPSLTKIWFAKSLQHESPLVSFLSSIFLLAAMQKAAKFLEVFAENSRELEEEDGAEGGWKGCAKRLREGLRNVLPDPMVVVALIQKSSVVVPKAVEDGKKKSKKGSKEKPVEVAVVVEDAKMNDVVIVVESSSAASTRHLRTNVALRLLWVYHRVAPSLITMLRFDFSKLPQAHVVPTEDAEGIRAISSAYALRLAAAHSTGGWYKASEYFKTTLTPLFKLYRTPSTPSNRTLLLSILSRLLDTPTLFGTPTTATAATKEVEIWLSSLPIPSITSLTSSSAILDFFQQSVQKTLTARADPSSEDKEDTQSPLFTTFMKDLPEALERAKKVEEKDELLKFIKLLVFGFMGKESDRVAVEKIVEVVGRAAGGETEKVLKDCWEVLNGSTVVAEGAEIEGIEEDSLSPLNGNVFVAESGDEALTAVLNKMPPTLLFLHVQPSTLTNPAIVPILVDIVVNRHAWSSVTQVILHRFLNSIWTDEERIAVVGFIVELLNSCVDERVKVEVKERLFGKSGLLGFYGEKKAPFAAIAKLIGLGLSSTSTTDVILSQPYCALLLEDAEAMSSRKKSSKPKKLSGRILNSSPLLPFLSTESSVALTNVLLSSIPPASLSFDPSLTVLLDDVLLHVASKPWTLTFHKMWTSQFTTLHRFVTLGGLSSAATVLARGANALLPFSSSASAISSSPEWRTHVDEWTRALLEGSTINPSQARVLAALIYRSASVRESFVAWLNHQASESGNDAFVDGAEAALHALLEVAEACHTKVEVADTIALRFTERILTGLAAASDEEELRSVVRLMCRLSPTSAEAVKSLLVSRVPTIDRDAHAAGVVHLLSELSTDSNEFIPSLEAFVNGSFAGLVRRFAEDEEDTEVVQALVERLVQAIEKHGKQLSYKTHLLDPLITAAITRRLSVPGPTTLAAALCAGHIWKENETTRLLNHVFANPQFQSRGAFDSAAEQSRSAMLRLVVALAASSIAAAASSRLVEKLMPFYGGTTSFDDVTLFDLFQRVELVGGTSVAVAFRQWDPSLDQSPLESTRAAALAALQNTYIRRCWTRACASSRTKLSKEHNEATYDPNFILAYLRQTLVDDELKPQEWTGILESGVLGVALTGLASSAASVRLLSRATLATALKKVEASTFREKEEVLLVLLQAKNCIFSAVGEAIPAVTGLFLAHCIGMVGTPESPLYPAFNSFLLQRALLDQRDVPMFYLLLYSAGEDPAADHKWIIKFLGDALVRTQDWRIYRRRQIFELLASLFQSKRADLPLRKLILQFVVRATSIPKAAQELFSKNGLLQWVSAQQSADAGERRLLADVVGNVVDIMMHANIGDAADVLDTLARLYLQVENLPSSEVPSLCSTLLKVVARLPPASANSMSTVLVLDRVRNLLAFVAPRLSQCGESQLSFYSLAMAITFARHQHGLLESALDRKLFSEGVTAGVAAGVENLRREALRNFAATAST